MAGFHRDTIRQIEKQATKHGFREWRDFLAYEYPRHKNTRRASLAIGIHEHTLARLCRSIGIETTCRGTSAKVGRFARGKHAQKQRLAEKGFAFDFDQIPKEKLSPDVSPCRGCGYEGYEKHCAAKCPRRLAWSRGVTQAADYIQSNHGYDFTVDQRVGVTDYAGA